MGDRADLAGGQGKHQNGYQKSESSVRPPPLSDTSTSFTLGKERPRAFEAGFSGAGVHTPAECAGQVSGSHSTLARRQGHRRGWEERARSPFLKAAVQSERLGLVFRGLCFRLRTGERRGRRSVDDGQAQAGAVADDHPQGVGDQLDFHDQLSDEHFLV